ncbi:MAG: NAD(P)H-dependent oxidoreductase, partial [Planctomycetota bacterium]
LVKDKPVFIAYARGGEYPAGTAGEGFDLQKRYVELILRFIGFSDIRSVVVEPTVVRGADVAKQKRAQAVEKARQMAGEF